MRQYKAVLFDLDGTLLDTIEDLADSMNAVLNRHKLPTHSIEKYKYYVGDGVDVLAVRALPDEQKRDEKLVNACVAEMREEYARRWDAKTRPYDGIGQMLAELRQRGLRLAVLSNKPDHATQEVIKRFFPDAPFEIVRGQLAGVAKKPDPSAALAIAAEMGLRPEDFLYLGDTNTDMKTAVSTGMYAVGATWGFRTAQELLDNGAKVLVNHPLELVKLAEE